MDVTFIFDIITSPSTDETKFLQVLYEGKKVVDARKREQELALEKGDFSAECLHHSYPNWLHHEEKADWRFKEFDR